MPNEQNRTPQSEESTRGDRNVSGAQRAASRAPARELTQKEIEASGTDGAGTGGVGYDAGGYGPVPGSEATG